MDELPCSGRARRPQLQVLKGTRVSSKASRECANVDERLVVQSDSDRPGPTLVLPHVRVVLHRSAPSGADAMARCLADVMARIPEGASVSALTAARDLELVNWEAEKYRQSLNKPAGAA